MDYLFKTPIDMPRGTHYGNNYWMFHSRKVGRRVTAFSNLEYANLLKLEMNPEVEYYCEQPCKQVVNIDGKKYDTVFDVYIVYKDGREEFQEVKYEEELESDTDQGKRSRKQIEIQKHWCLQNGYPYKVVTDKDIYIGKYTLRNLTNFASKARRYMKANKKADNSMIMLLTDKNKVTIGQLISMGRISETNGFDYLADLYFRGVITINDFDNEPISYATEVMLNGR